MVILRGFLWVLTSEVLPLFVCQPGPAGRSRLDPPPLDPHPVERRGSSRIFFLPAEPFCFFTGEVALRSRVRCPQLCPGGPWLGKVESRFSAENSLGAWGRRAAPSASRLRYVVDPYPLYHRPRGGWARRMWEGTPVACPGCQFHAGGGPRERPESRGVWVSPPYLPMHWRMAAGGRVRYKEGVRGREGVSPTPPLGRPPPHLPRGLPAKRSIFFYFWRFPQNFFWHF